MNKGLHSADSALRHRGFAVALVWLLIAVLTGCNAGSIGSGVSPDAKQGIAANAVQQKSGLTVVAALAEPPERTKKQSELISANDLLKVDVFQVDDLDRTVRVQSSGEISMPLIGTVTAAGLTVDELERKLERSYGRNYLQNPEISVFVEESLARRITLDGQFTKPGIYPVTSRSTLVEAVAQAGGLTRLADEDKVYVYRAYGDGRQVAKYSISDIRQGKARDPRVYGGDVVVSFTSGTKVAAENLRQALGLATSATRLATPF